MIAPFEPVVFYPDSDGEPMADNTLQWEWIATIKSNLEAIFQDDPDVFVAGDLLWYPVKGNAKLRYAPDAMVVFGRPKGYRGSYKQWEEGGLAPQVVFEVLSPNNTAEEMQQKREFYQGQGVEEYYEFDPEVHTLRGWCLKNGSYQPIPRIERGWTSPRLGVHFKIEGDLILTRPNGERFLSYTEMNNERNEAKRAVEVERQRAEIEHQRAEVEHQRAETERQRADAESKRAELLAAELELLKASLSRRESPPQEG